MTDWVVWPIFTLQLVILVLIFVKEKFRIFGLAPRIWVLILLLVAAIAIVISLSHDSTTILHLHF